MKMLKKSTVFCIAILSLLICETSFAGSSPLGIHKATFPDSGQVVPVRSLEALAPLSSAPARLSRGRITLQLDSDITGLKQTLKRAYLKRLTLPGGVKVRGIFHTTWGELHVTFSRAGRGQIIVFAPYGNTVIAQYRGRFGPR